MPRMTGTFREEHIRATDGLSLYVRIYPAAECRASSSLPVVCLPGLTRNSRDFHAFATLVSSDPDHPRTVYTIDSRGRGGSDRDDNKANYNLGVEATDVLTVCDSLNITRAAFAGTSRGGLILHLLTGMRPDLLAAVILNDIGPVVSLEGLREIQAYLSGSPALSGYEDAAISLKAVHGRNFPALTAEDWSEMAEALYTVREGQFTSDCDPAIAEQMRSMDLSKEGPTLWPQFTLFASRPVMVVRGQMSKLLTEATVAEMKTRIPELVTLQVPGQGHAPLLHHRDVFPAIRTFLAHC